MLLATIYVAIYAEQHGYYGSYYDNLENLGKPLHSLDNKVRPVMVWVLYVQWWCGSCTSSGGVGPVRPVMVWVLYVQ